MSLTEELRALRSQREKEQEEQRVQRIEREEEKRRLQSEQQEFEKIIRKQLDAKAMRFFGPILQTVNKEWLDGKGNIKTTIKFDNAGSVGLVWDESEDTYEGINIKIDRGDNIEVVRARKYDEPKINLRDENWRDEVANDILEIFQNGHIGTYHSFKPYEKVDLMP